MRLVHSVGQHRFRSAVTSLAVAFAVLAILSGCADLFTANYFSAFDGPPSSSDILAAGYDTSTEAGSTALLNALADAATSDRFFTGLTSDNRQAIRDELDTILTSGTNEQKVAASLIYADVTLKGTQAEATVDNLTAAIVGAADGGLTDPSSLLTSIIPADADTPEEIAAILTSFQTAAAAYQTLGTTLAAGQSAPSGTNMTSVAQSALVSVAVSNLIAQSDVTTLAGALAGDDPATAVTGLGLTDPISAEVDDASDPLNQIATAGGLEDFLASFF